MNNCIYRGKSGIYRGFVKRFLDILLSIIFMMLFSWLYILLAILIRIKLGAPILFIQERPGLYGNIFKMYKFRTMLSPQTKEGKILSDTERLQCLEQGIDVLSDEERLTKFGRILRSLSLDELPEMWNILKGDMSFIGPRPLSKIYLPYYTQEENRRHEVRPGLTGLAQVNGRNSASWETRFQYDVAYVDNISFFKDIQILLKTIAVVFSRKNIEQGEEKPEAFHVVRQREQGEFINKERR